MRKLIHIISISAFCLQGFAFPYAQSTMDTTNYLDSGNWDNYLDWNLSQQSGSTATTGNYMGLGDDTTHAIPYTLNHSADQEWVDTTKGFTYKYILV